MSWPTRRRMDPSAERTLMVSVNNSPAPVSTALSRGIRFGILTAVVLMMMGCQILVVTGAYLEGLGRAGVLAALATSFTILIVSLGSHANHVRRPAIAAAVNGPSAGPECCRTRNAPPPPYVTQPRAKHSHRKRSPAAPRILLTTRGRAPYHEKLFYLTRTISTMEWFFRCTSRTHE